MEDSILLEDVLDQTLNRALEFDPGSEGHVKTVKEIVELTDRVIELKKIADRKKELELKEKELELRKKSERIDKIFRYIEIAAIPLSIETIRCLFYFALSKEFMEYEKTGILSSTPLKMISKVLFRK